MFSTLSKENLHHAYLLVGPREVVKGGLSSFLESVIGGALAGNPDVEFLVHDSLGVDEARELGSRASLAPLGARRFFILEVGAATEPAQNALLKTLEDPRTGIHFFVLAEHEGVFLDTLLSRFYILRHEGVSDAPERLLAEKFLKASARERLELVKHLTEKLDDPDERRVQRRDAAVFLYALERALMEKLPASARAEKALREIAVLEPYFTDAAFSSRLVLEHLALSI